MVRDVGGLLGSLPTEIVKDVAMDNFQEQRSSPEMRLDYIRKEEEHIKEEEAELHSLAETQKEEVGLMYVRLLPFPALRILQLQREASVQHRWGNIMLNNMHWLNNQCPSTLKSLSIVSRSQYT